MVDLIKQISTSRVGQARLAYIIIEIIGNYLFAQNGHKKQCFEENQKRLSPKISLIYTRFFKMHNLKDLVVKKKMYFFKVTIICKYLPDLLLKGSNATQQYSEIMQLNPYVIPATKYLKLCWRHLKVCLSGIVPHIIRRIYLLQIFKIIL